MWVREILRFEEVRRMKHCILIKPNEKIGASGMLEKDKIRISISNRYASIVDKIMRE